MDNGIGREQPVRSRRRESSTGSSMHTVSASSCHGDSAACGRPVFLFKAASLITAGDIGSRRYGQITDDPGG